MAKCKTRKEGEDGFDPKWEPVVIDLADIASGVRYERETGGITINDMEIRTDRGSQAMIGGAYNDALANPTKTFDFKAASGWVTLSADLVLTIGQAVADHVQACFSAERDIDADIDAGTITTIEEVRTDPRWPG